MVKSKKSIKKIIFWILLSLIAVFGLVVISVVAFLDQIATTAVRTGGPYFTGTTVTLDGVNFSLADGNMAVKNMIVGNPPGYSTSEAIKFDQFLVDLQLDTITSDKIIINEVRITAPAINMEMSLLGNSNLNDIQDHINQITAKSAAPETQTPPDAADTAESTPEVKAQKQVVIRKLVIEGAVITLASKELTVGIPIPLPTLTLTDIGENSPTTIAQAIDYIYSELLMSIVDAVRNADLNIDFSGAADKLTKDSSAVIDAVSETLNNGSKDLGKGLKDLGTSFGL